MTTRKISTVHVGWELDIAEEKVRQSLEPVVGPFLLSLILTNPRVAVKYQSGEADMNNWFLARKNKPPESVYIRGLFVDGDEKKTKYAIAHVTIGALQQWVILYNGCNLSPMSVRKHVGQGKLGKEIVLEPRIQTTAIPYTYRSCCHSVHESRYCRSCVEDTEYEAQKKLNSKLGHV